MKNTIFNTDIFNLHNKMDVHNSQKNCSSKSTPLVLQKKSFIASAGTDTCAPQSYVSSLSFWTNFETILNVVGDTVVPYCIRWYFTFHFMFNCCRSGVASSILFLISRLFYQVSQISQSPQTSFFKKSKFLKFFKAALASNFFFGCYLSNFSNVSITYQFLQLYLSNVSVSQFLNHYC